MELLDEETRQALYQKARKELGELDHAALDQEAQKRSAMVAEIAEKNERSIRWDRMPTGKSSSARELTSHEVLLLEKIDGADIDNLLIPGYFTHDYHLNFDDSISAMFAAGLLCFADLRTNLERMALKGLKSILKDYNLPISGKKEAIVNRILSKCDIEPEDSRIVKRVVCTNAGRNLVDRYQILRYCQNNASVFLISLEEAMAMKDAHLDWSDSEIVRWILSNRLDHYLASGNFGLYRNTLYGISQTYHDESEPMKEAVCLFQCCYMDAVGYANGGVIRKSIAGLAPSLISGLRNLYPPESPRFDVDFLAAVDALTLPKPDQSERYVLQELKKALV